MTNEEIWQTVLAQIQLTTSPANFATWFMNTEIVAQKDNKATISVPNSFVQEWLENKYNKIILKILHDLNTDIKELKFVIGKGKSRPMSLSSAIIKIHAPPTDQLEFQELKIDKETNLNPRYIFDTLVVGPFNELAHAAACAVSESPGVVYNPLFIYGGVGLGKTHLLQSIGNDVIKNSNKTKKVKYIPSEKFTSEVVASIKNHQIDVFKEKYRAVDVLIIDDVQFLAGKEKTQEEFFHIFNVLYENNKQIVLSSDCPPKAIQSLAERLRSRFEGGMIVDISAPDLETRMAILKTKAQEKGVEMSEEICQFLASSIQRNIRELEGALNRLIMLKKKTPNMTIELVRETLKNIISAPAKMITPKQIIQTVAEFYDLKEKDLMDCSRKKEIVRPRQIAMYLVREELKSSFPFIGRKFKGKDHTTAIHSYKKILAEVKIDKKLEEEIGLIRERIFNA